MLPQLVLEELDADTNSVVAATPFVVNDAEAFEKAFDIEITAERTFESFELSAEETAQAAAMYGLPLLVSGALGRLRESSQHELLLSYTVHTNRELLLMLRSEKPLAAFSFVEGDIEEIDALGGQYFARYVDAGRIVCRDGASEAAGRRHHLKMFSLPGEEWRFNRYEALMAKLRGGQRWTEADEREEGSLLGYTDAQNDIFIEQVFRKRR